ncbi:MAG: TetR family transcriptional regulator [Phyllobacteriaceae bacterium]|nr:TetR family transcriptional regulator [Phyllobacteriaceae bacterium]
MADLASGADEAGGARKRNPEAVRADILAVAMAEFALNGLSGARIDEIAAKTRTSKRMIYYYFGDKDGLYERVLEEAYREVRAGENELALDHLEPVAALSRLVGFTFDHHSRNPDFIRLVMIENIHHGEYLERSSAIRDLNVTAIANLKSIYERGLAHGVFRAGLDPLELHWQISALSFFNVSNRATFSRLFGDRLWSDDGQRKLKADCIDMVLRFVLA